MLDLVLMVGFVIATMRQAIALCSMRRAARFLSGKRPVEMVPPSLAPKFIIAIPVLREQAIIRETVRYFQQFRKSPDVRLVFITAERELTDCETSSKETTVDVLRSFKVNEDIFAHVHCPNRDGMKADQLNYLVEV